MSMQSSMRDSHSHYHSLLQICWDKTHTEKSDHKSAEHLNSDQYSSKYSMSDKMIHETTDSAAILADRAAAVWENENRWAERSMIR